MSLNFPDTTANNPATGAPWAQGDTVVLDDITYVFNTNAGPPVTFWWSAATPGGTEGLWQRNGTVLTPFTNNDTVAVTQADGTQNIQLFPTGAATLAAGGLELLIQPNTTNSGEIQLNNDGGAAQSTLSGDGSASFSGGNLLWNNLGGVRQTIRTIAANGAWQISDGNLWQTDANAGSNNIDNPTNADPGLSGIIFTRQEITAWGNSFNFPGGNEPATVAANSVVPYYVVAANQILIGNATEDIT